MANPFTGDTQLSGGKEGVQPTFTLSSVRCPLARVRLVPREVYGRLARQRYRSCQSTEEAEEIRSGIWENMLSASRYTGSVNETDSIRHRGVTC